jgi:hypothetical protein
MSLHESIEARHVFGVLLLALLLYTLANRSKVIRRNGKPLRYEWTSSDPLPDKT